MYNLNLINVEIDTCRILATKCNPDLNCTLLLLLIIIILQRNTTYFQLLRFTK